MSGVIRMTQGELEERLRGQGADSPLDVVFICPQCKTAQSARDLIAAGAGRTMEDVQRFVGFSCVGRFTHGQPPPRVPGTQDGCNWTLGGLFQVHTHEYVDDQGAVHPMFEIASPETAAEHRGRTEARARQQAGRVAGESALPSAT